MQRTTGRKINCRLLTRCWISCRRDASNRDHSRCLYSKYELRPANTTATFLGELAAIFRVAVLLFVKPDNWNTLNGRGGGGA